MGKIRERQQADAAASRDRQQRLAFEASVPAVAKRDRERRRVQAERAIHEAASVERAGHGGVPSQGGVTAMKGKGTLRERYEQVKARVAAAAQRAGTRADKIILVAVTKYASIDQVREIVELGQADLGENHVQSLTHRAAQVEEFLQRHRELHTAKARTLPAKVRWHMIGHLQRNKVKKALGLARLIHSVDSLRLAEEIQTAAGRQDEPVEVLVQVNTSGERSKYGVAPAAARHLIEQMDSMMSIRVRGLMCMGPIVENPEDARPVFERARELFDDIKTSGIAGERFDLLSMGMSGDFEPAIECGANMVRVGSAIFGDEGKQQAMEEEEGSGAGIRD